MKAVTCSECAWLNFCSSFCVIRNTSSQVSLNNVHFSSSEWIFCWLWSRGYGVSYLLMPFSSFILFHSVFVSFVESIILWIFLFHLRSCCSLHFSLRSVLSLMNYLLRCSDKPCVSAISRKALYCISICLILSVVWNWNILGGFDTGIAALIKLLMVYSHSCVFWSMSAVVMLSKSVLGILFSSEILKMFRSVVLYINLSVPRVIIGAVESDNHWQVMWDSDITRFYYIVEVVMLIGKYLVRCCGRIFSD